MQVTSGRVIAGHVELETELPEGTKVTALVPEEDETFEADPQLERIRPFRTPSVKSWSESRR